MKIEQFEIWQTNLPFAQGSEQKGSRPCIILQTNAVNQFGRTVLVAPLTSQKVEKVYRCEVLAEPSKANGLNRPSKIKFDQIKSVDKQRLIKKLGILEDEYINDILLAIDAIFDLRGDFR